MHVGGFIGEPNKLDTWLLPKIDHWLLDIHQLAQDARQYPQAAYAALKKPLPMEWQYLHSVLRLQTFPSQGCHFHDFLDALFSTLLSATYTCKALAPLL